MFYWIIYILFVLAGLEVGPKLIYEISTNFSQHRPSFDSLTAVCIMLGTIITTVLFAFQIKHYKAYRYAPAICLIGFFSFLPGYVVGLLLVLLAFVVNGANR